MIIKLLYKISDIKRLIKIGLFIIISLIIYIVSSQTHANSIEFDDSILSLFTGITSNIVNAHFNYGGNDFYGAFFLLSPSDSGNTLTLSGETKICTKQIRGLYYNNQRGYRLWPLDQTTLNTLQTSTTGYTNLTMSGGRYTLCSGSSPDEMYGQITHNRYSGTIFNMIAGVEYNFTGNTYIGSLSGTLKFLDNYTGHFRDQRGGLAKFWGTGVPVLNQTGTCTGVVTNGVYWNGSSSYNIKQSRIGYGWTPLTGGIYQITPLENSCDFNCALGYDWSGAINQCIGLCGNGTLNTGEQCDPASTTGRACNNNCTLIVPSCTGGFSPTTGSSPLTVSFWIGSQTGIFRSLLVTTGGFSQFLYASLGTGGQGLSTTGTIIITGTYNVIFTGSNPFSGALNCIKTGSITVYDACGNGSIDVGEQCDDSNITAGDGCSATCQLETPICTLTNNSPKYTGQNVTFTGNTNSRAKLTDINFGDGNGVGISTNSSTYTGTYTYINSGNYTAILTTTSNITGTIIKTGTCNTTVNILANTGAICGNNTLEGSEQCDDGNTTSLDGCSAICILENPSCTLTSNSPKYTGQLVTFISTGGRAIFEGINFGDGGGTGTLSGSGSISTGHTYINSGSYTGTVVVRNQRSGTVKNTCATSVTILAATGFICGNNILEGSEQCDDGNTTSLDGCSAICILENPSCTLTSNSPKYTGQLVTFISTGGRAIFEGINFGDGGGTGTLSGSGSISTGHTYINSGSYTGTVVVRNQRSGSIKNTCTTSVTILAATGFICGNNILEGSEQCDDGNTTSLDGCSAICILETPSCTITNDSPKYTGQNVTFTGNTNSRAKLTDINFGNGNGVGISTNLSTHTTTYVYISSGIYTATLIATSNITGAGVGSKTGTCTTSVTILANTGAICGNNILEGTEQCDNGNTISGDGCSAVCILETPSCALTATPTTGYAPLSVLFSGTKNSRANYTLNFGTGTSTGTFTLPLTNIYSSTGTFTYSITGTSTLSGIYTCIQTGTITSIYSGVVCRSGRINQSGTCLLIGTGNTIATGTVNSGTTFYVPGNIIIYSSGNNSGGNIQISGINSISISYGNRDGIIIPPTELTGGSCSAATNILTSISSGLTNPVILLEFQAGASGSTITSNITGGYFTIKVKVNSGVIGNTYRIFRSAQCLTGREKVSIDELCILDSNKMCEFRTNKLSYFNIVSNNSIGVGTPMIVGTIPRLRNAQIDKAYMSDPFTIANFNDTTLATVSKGMLYINGVAIGTGGYVQNGDELNIELYSSKKYDTTISSKITVGSVSTTFYITTIVEGDDNSNYLSNLQKIRIMSIFNLLIELYSDNPSKEAEFLYTLRSMLMDKLEILDTNDDAYSTFEYLLSLIDARLLISGIDESNHIAANCKEYQVTFENGERAYYSPDFKKLQYFSTRESLIRYIDSKNPGDCRINTYGSDYVDIRNTNPDKHISPNGKVYRIENNNGGYTSPDLSNTKYFDTLQGLRAYLNINNPATLIRNHILDISFNPINYIAENGKIYKIYKTDKGYMSYKLIKVRYFSTLDGIKLFINNNNKI